MSILEKFKPQMHFSPAFGWINDPNGLVYSKGQWHLFYQYFPMDIVWGPMHWGHAISTDLINWKHYPIAIAPDEHGHMFSGSAIVDKKNTSGLFDTESEGNLIIYYTASMPRYNICPDDLQTQCLAYSKDGGLSWEKYEKNPILPNPDLACYRDPKVLWVESAQHWVMVLTHGQSIGIYKSDNLIHWQYCSEFGEGFHSNGPWECPDLFELTSESGLKKWVLVVGVGPHDKDKNYAKTPCTQYFIGDFDGERFINDNHPDEFFWLDSGCDYYATQSYFNAPDNKRIGLSWMSNWVYSRNVETKSFRGIMTLPREFKLVDELSGKVNIAQSFCLDVNQHFNEQVTVSSNNPLSINTDVYHIKSNLNLSEIDSVKIFLFGMDKPIIEIEKIKNGIQIRSIRYYDGDEPVMKKEFPHNYVVHHPCQSEITSLEMMVDKGTVELLLDGGRFSMTQLHYPSCPDGDIIFTGNGWCNIEINKDYNKVL